MTCCIFFWSMNFLDWSSSQDARAQNWPGIQEVRSATMADNPQTNRDDLFEIVRDGDIAEAKKALASAEMSWRHSALGQNFLFFVAARRRRGCEELAKQCIAMRINLEEVDLNGQTPLFWAAKRGNLVMIKLLLNVGFEVNFRDKARKTALFFAIENGHLDVADCLIERSASTLVRASNGKTPRAMLKEKNHKAPARKRKWAEPSPSLVCPGAEVRSRFAEWEWASAEGESEPMVGKEEDNVLVEDSRHLRGKDSMDVRFKVTRTRKNKIARKIEQQYKDHKDKNNNNYNNNFTSSSNSSNNNKRHHDNSNSSSTTKSSTAGAT